MAYLVYVFYRGVIWGYVNNSTVIIDTDISVSKICSSPTLLLRYHSKHIL